MWTIDQLKLTLPPGFEGRAERIGRHLAAELAALPAPAGFEIETLALPPVALTAGLGDREVAARIARQIGAHVAGLAATPATPTTPQEGPGSVGLRGPVTGCAERPKEPARRTQRSQYPQEG